MKRIDFGELMGTAAMTAPLPPPVTVKADVTGAASNHFMEILGLLLDGSPAMIGLKDMDGRYVFANRELEFLFGAASGEVSGAADGRFMPAAAAAALARKDREVALAGSPAKSMDAFVVAGRRVDCATVRFPYRDERGSVIGTGFVAIEVRDRDPAQLEDGLSMDSARKTIAELQQAVADMSLRASTDRLTMAWNRSRIEESAQHELLRLERYGHPVALVFIDIDHFKRINDQHGHGVGDAVLLGTCDVVRRCIRSTDLLGRWGGEEFLLLLPNNGLTSARLLAERVRTTLMQHRFADAGPVTASFGVAQCRRGETWDSLLARADAAMYRAKEGGRNRVEVDAGDAADADAPENLDAGFVQLVWRKAYESGHPLIDEQHRGLFAQANALLAAIINGHPRDDIAPLIDDLIASNATHFRTEEAIFRTSGFPGADAHAEIHGKLLARCTELSGKFAAKELHLGELFQFIAYEVIARHILATDRKFFPYLADRPG